MLTTDDCPDKLYDLLVKLSKDKLIDVMYSAVDHMGSYNGRTSYTCIMLGLGGTKTEKGWKIEKAAMEELFNDQPDDTGGAALAGTVATPTQTDPAPAEAEPTFTERELVFLARALEKYTKAIVAVDDQSPFTDELRGAYKKVADIQQYREKAAGQLKPV